MALTLSGADHVFGLAQVGFKLLALALPGGLAALDNDRFAITISGCIVGGLECGQLFGCAFG